jgi:hypothetical protein
VDRRARTNAETRQGTLEALARFEARRSPDGLFLRYARGRIRAFAARQVMTLAGAAALWLLGDARIGLTVLLFGMIGDALDCLFLRAVLRRYGEGPLPAPVLRAATASAGFQGLSVAACICVAWMLVPGEGIRFFSTAFLFGALINAGLARPYAPALADARITAYGVTLLMLALHDLALAPHPAVWLQANAAYLIATAMLAYSAVQFLTYVGRSFARNTAFEHDLLREQHKLALSTEALSLREAQARKLALVAENANDSVLIYDAEGRIEWVNETFTRITGFSREEVQGRFPADVLNSDGTDPATTATLVRCRREGEPCRVEILNRTRDGRTIWLEASSTPVRNPDGTLAMTINVERDITEARARAAELAEARQRAEAAAEAKSRFLATMSHEIRTPMNGVIGMAELLAETPLDPGQREQVGVILDCGQALLALINDILDLSRMQAGKMVTARAAFDAAALVRGVAALLTPMATAKGLELQLFPHNLAPLWVAGDEGRVRQVVVNLLGNAIKFTRAGRVTLRLAARPGGDGTTALAIEVADTGIGIPADRLAAIFDSFTQADGSISREFGGTGLGLSISRLLAREMGGDIRVRSEVGRGSAFTLDLTLPTADPPLAATGRAPPPRLAGRRVLLAEDNRTNRLILRRLLEPLAVDLTEVENGADAVQSWREVRPDLVLMDMQMPVMDGIAAIRAIRAEEASTGRGRCPIVMLTANALSEDRDACRAAGSDDFLTKPVQRDLLYDRLAALVPGAAAA